MSEKRFKANFDVSIYDSEKEEYISVSERGLEEIAKRMNELQDKITELEIELTDCKNRKEQSEYTLQKEIKDLNFVINFQEKEIGALKALLKENEGLEEAYDIAKENNELLKQKNTKLIAKIDFLERVIDGDV